MSPSWSDMPSCIGHMIIGKLPEVVEHIRFGAVCKQWCDISWEHQRLNKSFRNELPMLLIPSPDAPVIKDPPKLYAVSCLGKYYSNINIRIPFCSERYCGSSYGWIVMQNDDCTVTLVNPFGREVRTIQLPGIQHWSRPTYHFPIDRVFISPDSTPNNYTVVAIYGEFGELAIIKSGEECWEYVPPRQEVAPASLFYNVIFYQGNVYAVSEYCMVVNIDIHARPPRVNILLPLNRKRLFSRTYLVESTSSELYYVQRYYAPFCPRVGRITNGFNIFKLKLHEKTVELIDQKDAKSLNGDTFFIGDNTSIAIQNQGCLSDSIYFTDDLHDPGYIKPSGPVDIGCYNIKDETITPFYICNPAHKNGVTRPIWICPCFNFVLL